MPHTTVFIQKKSDTKATCKIENREVEVNIGRNGAITETEKTEGDGKTPLGTYHFKTVYYRADKIDRPETLLPVAQITKDMGWCDDPKHPSYNRLIAKPFQSSHEDMHRNDDVYDLVVEISHNNDPVVPEMGSAVFLHLKRDDNAPTAGCIAFDEKDLRDVLKTAYTTSEIMICMR